MGGNKLVLKELCALRGVSGNEHEVRDFLLEKVRKTADEVRVDRMGNVLAVKKADRAMRRPSCWTRTWTKWA